MLNLPSKKITKGVGGEESVTSLTRKGKQLYPEKPIKIPVRCTRRLKSTVNHDPVMTWNYPIHRYHGTKLTNEDKILLRERFNDLLGRGKGLSATAALQRGHRQSIKIASSRPVGRLRRVGDRGTFEVRQCASRTKAPSTQTIICSAPV